MAQQTAHRQERKGFGTGSCSSQNKGTNSKGQEQYGADAELGIVHLSTDNHHLPLTPAGSQLWGLWGTLLKSEFINDLQVSNISANVNAKTSFLWALKKNAGVG